MRRAVAVSFLLIVQVLCFSVAAGAQTSDSTMSSISDYLVGLGLSRDTLEDIEDIIEHRAMPIVKDVVIEPEAPEADEPVTVSAVVVTPPEMSGDKISDVYLDYSIDGGEEWNRVIMDQDGEDVRMWSGTIPGQPSGTDVIYGIQALNYMDELSVEAVCRTGDDIFAESGVSSEECEGEKNPELCEALRPHGCMFPMSVSAEEFKLYEDDISDIPEDMNIRSTRIGYDDENIYIELSVEGEVSPGQMSPTDIHIYVAAWLNPDKKKRGADLDSILEQGAAVISIPLNPTDKCAVYSVHGATLFVDNQSVSCALSDNRVVYTVRREVLEPNPSRTMEFLFMTLSQQSLSLPDVALKDASLFTRVSFMDSSIYSVP